MSALHSAASKWYAQEDFTTEAVNHSLTAGEFDWAVGQIEGNIMSMIGRSQVLMATNWSEPLPADLVNTRPQLRLAHSS